MNPWVVLVTAAALLFAFGTGANVARNRMRHGVPPPAMAGNPAVERALRVQGNTLEGIVIFLPALWIFSGYWDPRIGAAIGAVWVIGRIIYMVGYMADPDKRFAGYGIQTLAILALVVGAIAGAVKDLI